MMKDGAKMKYFFYAFIINMISILPSYGQATPQDINSFWKATREKLSAIPINAKVEKVAEALPYKKFRVTVTSLNNVRITAFFSLPVQGEAPAKPWPIIISAPGYSGHQGGVMLSECMRGYAIVQVFPRGQGESEKLWNTGGHDKLTWHISQPEGAYYQGAYADVMRVIDYMVTRPDVDTTRIAMMGTSQGGGISLAITALDKRIKAVVAHVPFLCNFRLAATTPSLVKRLLDKEGVNNEASLTTLDYFDPYQLAPKIHVPVLMSAGGKDVVCPKETIQSVYKRIKAKKKLRFYPDLPHTTCFDFYNRTWPWLDKHFRKKHA